MPRQNPNCIFSRDRWNGWLMQPWLMRINTLKIKDKDCLVWANNRSYALVHGLHGLVHKELPVSPSFKALFAGCWVILAPTIAAGLLWTPFYRIGSWLLLSSIAGSLLSESTIIS